MTSTAFSALDDKELDRISSWFENNDVGGEQSYIDILSEIAQAKESEDESMQSERFMEWVDRVHPQFKGLLGKDKAYYPNVISVVKRGWSRNSSAVSSVSQVPIEPNVDAGVAEGFRAASVEEFKNRMLDEKGIAKKWNKTEEEEIVKYVTYGLDMKSAWNNFMADKITKGEYTRGRTYSSFRRKHLRIRKQMQVIKGEI